MFQILFVRDWLEKHQINKYEWDIGSESKDNILFPLSDSWRKNEDRVKDSTYIVSRLYNEMCWK
jgi:hypothetical protein